MSDQSIESIWEGVYSSFADAPDAEAVFNSDIWVKKQQQRILEKLHTLEANKNISDAAVSKDYPLAAMIAVLRHKKPLRIIDYGGAMGQSYLELMAKIPGIEDRVDYIVVEMPALVKDVPEEIKDIKGLSFVDDIKNLAGNADIVHIGSTLQYVDDWQGLLTKFSKKFQPDFFILSDLLVGDIPSFVTIQNYYDHSIKVRFTNIEEFITFWEKTDYNLVYRSYYQPLNDGSYFPNHALPKTHRIKKACHLVFSRDDYE